MPMWLIGGFQKANTESCFLLLLFRVLLAHRMYRVPELSHAVAAHISLAGFRVVRDTDGPGYIRGRFLAEPDVRQLFVERNIFLVDDDFLAGSLVTVEDHGVNPRGTITKEARVLFLALQRISLVDHHCSPLAGSERIEDERDLGRIVALQVIKHQRRTVVLAQQSHQRLKFVVAVCDFDSLVAILELTVLAQDVQKLPHVLIGH